MQIHELNTYGGELNSSAYMAIDNGTDTGKVSAQRLLADVNKEIDELESSLNERIDNIIAGGDAPSAAEITDARLGANGEVYPSLGDAIRDQVLKVNESVSERLPYYFETEGAESFGLDINFVNDDMSIASSQSGDHKAGDLIPYPGYAVSDYIDLSDVIGIYRFGTTIKFTLESYAFYDEFYTFTNIVPATTDYEIVTYEGRQVTWLDLEQAGQNAKYIRITHQKTRPYTFVVVRKDNTFYIPHVNIGGVEPFKFFGKTIVNFGDSIYGNFRDADDTADKSVTQMIKEATGATVYNAGFGGCRMAYHSTPWRAFSMYALADSIASGDWSVQEDALTSGSSQLPSYFSDTVAMLKTIDFSNVDYITIGYGTNDYAGDIFIYGTEAVFSNKYDYFKGALEYSLEKILTAYPHIRIAVISPCWRWFLSGGSYAYDSDDDQSANTRGYILPQYVDAEKTVCEAYHVPFIDAYYMLGFNPYTYTEYFPANDGTHPNQNGRQLLADRIIGQMNSLY